MRIQHHLPFVVCVGLLVLAAGCRTQTGATAPVGQTWRGVHLAVESDRRLAVLQGQLPKLAADGVNVLVIQVDYHFDFQSHPELRDNPFITRAGARAFSRAARKLGIRIIPELDCLGHQSWAKTTFPLLAKYPQFDETRGQFPGNKRIYCRSWCPSNPGVNKVVFALIDELTDAFQADAFHVGMDEVFIIADPHCPRCRGRDPAKLFAKAVNDLHRHIVGKRGLAMLMWGDRLLDANTMGCGRWEASANGTARAADLIPKDIVLCDWHYREQTNYPSVPFLLAKGFRVWPSGFQPLAATEAFSRFSLEQRRRNKRVLGYLCTTWNKATPASAGDWPPITEILPNWKPDRVPRRF
ncbi:MAG: family 20 glycosylhydrolase [Verrucomicrobiota bacterium]|nr:family 20 glycosylhydrolase [Verrucomicrobiota bacterium]